MRDLLYLAIQTPHLVWMIDQSINTLLPLGAFVWKTFKKWCPFGVRCPSGDFVIFAIFAFTVLTWPYMGHRYCLLKKIKCSFLEPSSLIICQDQLWWLFFSFFQKLQKSPRVVSGGKMRKRKQKDSFPQCKNVQKYIFLETRALDLRQIDITEHHFLNSSTQEPQGATLALRV